MEFKEIRELIKIIDESGLTSFEMERENFRISLKKEVEKVCSREVVQQGVYTELVSAQSGGQSAQSGGQPVEPSSEGQKYQKTINSPIVGTFYIAPSPGAEPFVKPGSVVKKGSTLCIIEAMKLMNEIEADEDLEILEVLATDGEMVEYGQPLFAVK